MSKASILIVEDSFIVAKHLQQTLEGEGYYVVGTESSGEQALKTIEKRSPDLVLMDIMLTGQLDGVETSRIIKSKFGLPVIYITALSDKETIQRAKITEPFGFITKPFEDRELFTTIEMALYKHSIDTRLKQSEEKYFSTVKSIGDGVILTDANYNVMYMNPSAVKILGVSESDGIGKSVFQVVRLQDSLTGDYPVNPFQSSLQSRVNSLPENLILHPRKNTPDKPIGDGSISPIIDSKGNLLGSVMIFRDISEKVMNEKLVKEFETQRLAAILQGQEQERSRIAKDLHDGLGQLLNAIKLNVNFLSSDPSKVNVLYKLIDEAIQESIRISENLLPSKLKDFDLATCLNSLCKQIDGMTDTPVIFESFGMAAHVNQTQKINFYRIAQEAINNAIKHAQANTISVQLNEEDDRVQLTIEDDGKGFERTKEYDRSRHHGLDNMRERAEIMGGKLTIESDADRGTLIIVEAPINNNHHGEV
jgi:signal transduction histidine kinase